MCVHDPLSYPQSLGAGGGEPNVAGVAFQQLCAQLTLQVRDRAAQRGLRHVQIFSGRGETSRTGDGGIRRELAQGGFHEQRA